MEPQAISSDLIRGHIDTIILYTLIDNDKFAQQISDSIEEKSQKEYKINQATLYSSLKRLENLKMVTSYWNDSPSGRRKYFKLTEKGKETVDGNLSNWAYSRSIIDRLMDCSPEPIYQTKVVEVEKIVEKVVEVEVPVVREVEVPVKVIEKVVEQVPVKEEVQAQVSPNLSVSERKESSNELNFRAILGGLIKANEKISEPITEEQNSSRESAEEIEHKQQVFTEEKPKFNEMLTAINYNPNKSMQAGKIDFGDLILKAKKDGYKLRVSSKESYAQVGNLLIGKLKFFASFFIFLISILEFFAVTIKFGDLYDFNVTTICITCAILSIFPIITLILYLRKPNKSISDKISVDCILTSAIIVFNLLLITMSGNLLANVDFADVKTTLLSVIIPCVLFINVLIYYVIKYFISKCPIFIVKNKKS